jgi:hypothetical protein
VHNRRPFNEVNEVNNITSQSYRPLKTPQQSLQQTNESTPPESFPQSSSFISSHSQALQQCLNSTFFIPRGVGFGPDRGAMANERLFQSFDGRDPSGSSSQSFILGIS